ncbi:hypothetical protein [Moorena sp. SIO1F2]|nr:hypothetical protein [Moorena sp. SIO1F2]
MLFAFGFPGNGQDARSTKMAIPGTWSNSFNEMYPYSLAYT